MAAAAVDREFWCICVSFELNLKCPGMLSGPHCVPFASLWGTFGISLGHLGQSWGALWATWGCLGASSECLGIALGMPWDYSGPHCKKRDRRTPIASRWLSSTAPAHKNRPAGACPPVQPVPAKRSANYRSGPTFHTRRGSG